MSPEVNRNFNLVLEPGSEGGYTKSIAKIFALISESKNY